MRMPGGIACAASPPGLRLLWNAMSITRGGITFMPRAMPYEFGAPPRPPPIIPAMAPPMSPGMSISGMPAMVPVDTSSQSWALGGLTVCACRPAPAQAPATMIDNARWRRSWLCMMEVE